MPEIAKKAVRVLKYVGRAMMVDEAVARKLGDQCMKTKEYYL